MDDYLHAAKVGRHSAVELAQSYLKGYAATWWRTVRQEEGKSHGYTVATSKVLALNATLAQKECNRLIFLEGKIAKRDVLCLLDTGASHNFITRESAERMELHLEELKAPIEVHFADGIPHPTTLQAKG
ncbi:unnamed protein product, partial [Sphagnum troendelagicum]